MTKLTVRYVSFVIALFTFASSTALAAVSPIRQVVNHLNNAKAILEQPNVQRPKKWENQIAAELSHAMSALDSVKNNKGTHLPDAIKAVKAAQDELAAGTDETHIAKALEYVIEASRQADKAWDVNRRKK